MLVCLNLVPHWYWLKIIWSAFDDHFVSQTMKGVWIFFIPHSAIILIINTCHISLCVHWFFLIFTIKIARVFSFSLIFLLGVQAFINGCMWNNKDVYDNKKKKVNLLSRCSYLPSSIHNVLCFFYLNIFLINKNG